MNMETKKLNKNEIRDKGEMNTMNNNTELTITKTHFVNIDYICKPDEHKPAKDFNSWLARPDVKTFAERIVRRFRTEAVMTHWAMPYLFGHWRIFQEYSAFLNYPSDTWELDDTIDSPELWNRFRDYAEHLRESIVRPINPENPLQGIIVPVKVLMAKDPERVENEISLGEQITQIVDDALFHWEKAGKDRVWTKGWLLTEISDTVDALAL